MTKPQIYKIYINEVEVILKPTSELSMDNVMTGNNAVIKYSGNKKQLLQYIAMADAQLFSDRLIIHFDDFKQLKSDFKSHFTEIEAGGGLVYNEDKEFLFIYRRGSWDLPKGKIEANESKKEAALREISEETGIKKMNIVKKLMVTRHTYRSNVGKRIIKKSHWYLIETKKQPLKPQTTEDIEKAQWMTIESFLSKKRKVYPNILEVVMTQINANVNSKVTVKIK
ncbi:MAG: NUDIX domain-containing protein [Saprospiraceae bacterium]|nr:NUDIX domain-containing protein [Saprospiraceae bacterium]